MRRLLKRSLEEEAEALEEVERAAERLLREVAHAR